YWTSPDLTAVIRVFVSNLDVLDAMEGGIARLGRPFIQPVQRLNERTTQPCYSAFHRVQHIQVADENPDDGSQ
ncbi:hypothetical protein QCD79_34235, partial [Pseudomonas quasicaspiana]|nr:hypothetical protein [Pseudomonas quasicaspiana]